MNKDQHRLDPSRMVVLSLRPRFARAIIDGVKTVELRRTEPQIVVPTLALLYAASPAKALVGTCVVTSVQTADLAALWRQYGAESDLRYGEFIDYFEGLERGTALTLTEPQALGRDVSLEELRAGARSFCPPQSFAYVDATTGDRLLRLAA